VRRWSCVAVLSLAVAGVAPAAGPAKVEPVLKPDDALLAKIAALPDNTWLRLPPLKVAGDLKWLRDPDLRRRGPFCRDYSNWMVWAPERKRALYCGGGHNILPWNDVWEYDLASNTWACLSPADSVSPAKPRGQPLAEFVKTSATFTGGVVRAKNGGPLRPAHTWCGLVYHPERRQMLFLEVHQGLIFTDKAALAKGFGLTAEQFQKQRKPGSYIWAYDAVKKTWDAEVETGVAGGEGAIMCYLPDRKTLWIKSARGGTVLYDPKKKTWTTLAKCPVGYGAVGAYDPNTRTAVVINAGRDRTTKKAAFTTHTYSFDTNEWKRAHANAPAGGRDAGCHFHYDTAAKKFVLLTNYVKPRLWLYDVTANTWTDPKPKGDVPPGGRLAGYYDPARNVFVNYDSRSVYVYRCQRRKRDTEEKK